MLFLSEASADASLLKVLKSVQGAMQRLEQTAIARAMVALATGELKDHNYSDILPKSMHSIGHALQVPWEKELEEMNKATELPLFLSKLDMAEAAAAAAGTSSLQDPVFSKTIGQCKEFCQSFVRNLRGALICKGSLWWAHWTHSGRSMNFWRRLLRVGS